MSGSRVAKFLCFACGHPLMHHWECGMQPRTRKERRKHPLLGCTRCDCSFAFTIGTPIWERLG